MPQAGSNGGNTVADDQNGAGFTRYRLRLRRIEARSNPGFTFFFPLMQAFAGLALRRKQVSPGRAEGAGARKMHRAERPELASVLSADQRAMSELAKGLGLRTGPKQSSGPLARYIAAAEGTAGFTVVWP
jgi:hypothetical protein